MIYKYEKYTELNNTICPYCLNNYLDNMKYSLFEGVQEEENVYTKSHHGRREAPRYNVDVRSMSILVPTHGCVNSCKFCVSKISQRKDEYSDRSREEIFEEEYFKKFEQISKMGCTYAILTGTGEPIQNKPFLSMIGRMNKRLENPFKLEIQTSGVMLNDTNLNFLKNEVGVYLISLSISDIFDNKSNAGFVRIRPRLQFDLKDLCHRIKSHGFILRLSLNLVNIYNKYNPEEVIRRLHEIGADQATLRVLWSGKDDNEISRWIRSNKASEDFVVNMELYCQQNGKQLSALYPKYQIHDMTLVIDDDCMAEKSVGEIRYLILRSDCNLYTKWDTKSSLFNQ